MGLTQAAAVTLLSASCWLHQAKCTVCATVLAKIAHMSVATCQGDITDARVPVTCMTDAHDCSMHNGVAWDLWAANELHPELSLMTHVWATARSCGVALLATD